MLPACLNQRVRSRDSESGILESGVRCPDVWSLESGVWGLGSGDLAPQSGGLSHTDGELETF